MASAALDPLWSWLDDFAARVGGVELRGGMGSAIPEREEGMGVELVSKSC